MTDNIKDPSLKKPTPDDIAVESPNSELKTFLLDALKDIYWAEKALVKALPKLLDAVTTDELGFAIEEHLAQTQNHVTRLEEVFQILGQSPEEKICFAMEGLLKESDSIVEETEAGSVTRDAAIIMAAQKVEHYEIATYGSLVELAKTLGLKDVHGIFQLTLDEEKLADHGLTIIAQNKVNWEAVAELV